MRLVILRREKGWTQAALSKASGVSQTYISELETGKKQPTLPVLLRLAGALGVSILELIEENEPVIH
ncbi:MAG: helix-turn-helix domain-containing protein [Solirubrobacterales bacterium]